MDVLDCNRHVCGGWGVGGGGATGCVSFIGSGNRCRRYKPLKFEFSNDLMCWNLYWNFVMTCLNGFVLKIE